MSSDSKSRVKGSLKTLDQLKFDNLILRALPIDKETRNYPRSPVPGACFSIVDPTPIEEPILVAASLDALRIIDIDPSEVVRSDFAEYFCGNKILPGARPAAHCYCGHQFGYFSGQLGDGATMYLGEIINGKGQRWEIQFKGAGKTPYSRTADGRKVLRSSIREFLCSEAMANLGIPTTRAPSCVTSKKTTVVRDVFYDGNPKDEQCTVITRLAKSFLRFGSFEIVKEEDTTTGRAGPSAGRTDILEKLIDHTIKTYYPTILAAHPDETKKERRYLEFYSEVVRSTARLVAMWQCVGWCHGVLNTDNMSILALTIDYGPFGFMERTDDDYVCNASDNDGRYSYGNQPKMCRWNCMKLAEALQLLVPLKETKEILEQTWDKSYKTAYYEGMKQKLGLVHEAERNEEEEKEDILLIDSLLEIMKETGADFTITFRSLSTFVKLAHQAGDDEKKRTPKLSSDQKSFLDMLMKSALSSYDEILETLKPSMPLEQIRMLVMMARQQHFLLQRFPQLVSDLRKLQKLEEFKKTTEEKRLENNRIKWSSWLLKYRSRILDAASGSNAKKEQILSKIAKEMDSKNPKYILRNHMLQDAIDRAEAGDFTGVRALLQLTANPYAEMPGEIPGLKEKDLDRYKERAPREAAKLCVT